MYIVTSIEQVYTLNTQMAEMTTTTDTLTNNMKNLQETFDSKLEILRNGWKFNQNPVFIFSSFAQRTELTFFKLYDFQYPPFNQL